MQRLLLVLGVLNALNILGALAAVPAGVPACVETCADQVRNTFTTYSCTSAVDASCLCASNNFKFAIRDCSSATCKATEADVETYLQANFCKGLPNPSSKAPATSSQTSSQAPASSTQAAPSSTQPATTSTTSTSSTSSSASSSTSTQSTATSQTSQSVASTPSAAATTPSSSSTPALATPAATKATDQGADGSSSPASLSTAATVGIGVGVGAAAIAAVGIVLCCFLRKRNKRATVAPAYQISKPLPGSGRMYPSPEHSSIEKSNYDIEMTSQRYDELPPRQTPRTML